MSANSVVCTPSARLTWKIDNFSKINTKKVYSDAFCVGGYNWKLLIFPKGNSVDYLSVFLAVADAKALPLGWGIKTDFSLSVVDQNNKKNSVKEELEKERVFCATQSDWGFNSFMSLSNLHDPCKSYLVNDSCVVEADIWVLNSKTSNGVLRLAFKMFQFSMSILMPNLLTGTVSSKLKMAKIDIGGEEIKVTKAEMKKRAKAVTFMAPSTTSETLLLHSEASVMADPKIALDISGSLLLPSDEKEMSSKGITTMAEEAKFGLVQAIARQEFLIRQLLIKDDKAKNAETEINNMKKEAEQNAKELLEVKAKRSDLDSEVEQLRDTLTEEKRARKEVESTVAELKEKCLNVYSAGYIACEKEMKRIAAEKGFLDLFPDSDDEEPTDGMENIKEVMTEKSAEDRVT